MLTSTDPSSPTTWHPIGPLDGFKGHRALVHTTPSNASEEPLLIVLIRRDSGGSGAPPKIMAIDAVCPHSGGPLHFGDIEDLGTTTEDADCLITCPWHAFRYSLIDGTSPEDEDHDALVFETRIIKSDGDGVMVVEVCVDGDRGVERVEWIPEPGTNDLTVESSETIITQTLETMTLSIPNTTSSKHPQHPETLAEWASLILRTPNAQDKVDLTYKVASMWNSGDIKEVGVGDPPEMPYRPSELVFTAPTHAGKRGRGGTLESRIAILHALANIEQWAIDLAWDLISRFPCLPHALYTDFVRIATEEAHHFELLVSRLTRLGSFYGALSVHGSLWDSALETRHDILARLAIVHMVHEARGLDVNPKTIQKFISAGDSESVTSLQKIHSDEIGHVAIGQKWFTVLCGESADRYETFHGLVRKHYYGYLKPPFNEEDRAKAGLDVQYYIPLSKK